jgi:hypothetical protein
MKIQVILHPSSFILQPSSIDYENPSLMVTLVSAHQMKSLLAGSLA